MVVVVLKEGGGSFHKLGGRVVGGSVYIQYRFQIIFLCKFQVSGQGGNFYSDVVGILSVSSNIFRCWPH